jgi:hypothetical protein
MKKSRASEEQMVKILGEAGRQRRYAQNRSHWPRTCGAQILRSELDLLRFRRR